MNAFRTLAAFVTILLMAPTAGNAQRVDGAADQSSPFVAGVEVIESAPLESMALVRNAPFSADAVTEFTQILGDGNRIERRYASSIARDSRGRTRREEEIAMVGPFAGSGPTPRLVTILDPDGRVSY